MSPKTKKGMTARQRRKETRRLVQEDPNFVQSETQVLEKETPVEVDDFRLDIDPDLLPPSMLLADDIADDSTEEKAHYPMGMDESFEAVGVFGPTSFEEIEEEEQAQEKSRKIQEVAFKTERIASNIVRNPVMEPEEKAEAFTKVGSEMRDRINSIIGEQKSFDYDLLHTEMLLGMAEPDNFIEKASDFLEKAKLTSSARSSLPDSSFALIREGKNGKKVRKYPVHDKAHVRNALARAAQMIKRGGQAAKDARAALPKIRKAAKRMNIGMPSKENPNSIYIEKDTNGDYRWVGYVSNKFMDREGDILADAAHKEYVEFLNENPDMAPQFWSWHTVGTARENKVDAWDYQNGFLMMSGKLTPSEAKGLMKASAQQRLGMSHTFLPLARDSNNPKIITKYRTIEVCDLPLNVASNLLTDIDMLAKETLSMNKKADYLKTVLGPDQYDKLLSDTEDRKAIAEALGIPEKELTTEDPETEKVEGVEAEDAEETVESEEEEAVEEEKSLSPELVNLLKKELGVEDLPAVLEQADVVFKMLPLMTKKIDDLNSQVTQLTKESNEQLADILESKISKREKIVKTRPSESDDNVLDDEALKEYKKPEHDNTWLTDFAGAEPIPANVKP